ncbi:unnamed protein product [Brassica oleracea var. botrytis]
MNRVHPNEPAKGYPRRLRSPWMPFPLLIKALSKFLPPSQIFIIQKHYRVQQWIPELKLRAWCPHHPCWIKACHTSGVATALAKEEEEQRAEGKLHPMMNNDDWKALLRDKLVLLDVETKGRLVLNVTLGTQFYFYHESQATQYAGSAEQRVVPLVYLPKYGGVKKLESVRLSELNIYVLNSPLQHHTSDDMSIAVKLSMVPNPVVKSSCSYHTIGPDDVPIIEGCPASTDPEPAHTDSVLTSTETPIDDEKAPGSK